MQVILTIGFIIINCIYQVSCSNCLENYFLNKTTRLCIQCPDKCWGCMDIIGCSHCTYNNYFNRTANLCLRCHDKCKICTNEIGCQHCHNGYYLNRTSNSCIICDQNCQGCYSHGCQRCREGYKLDRYNNCMLISFDNDAHIIIPYILLGMIVLFILLAAILYYRKHYLQRLSQNNQNQSTQVRMMSAVQNKLDILDDCSICLENKCDLITNCNHWHHSSCLKSWTLKQKYCPICKNTNLSTLKVLTCLDCANELVVFDVFHDHFLKNIEKTRNNHKCKNKALDA